MAVAGVGCDSYGADSYGADIATFGQTGSNKKMECRTLYQTLHLAGSFWSLFFEEAYEFANPKDERC